MIRFIEIISFLLMIFSALAHGELKTVNESFSKASIAVCIISGSTFLMCMILKSITTYRREKREN